MFNLMRKQSLCKWLKSAEALLIVLVLETLNLVLEPMTGEFDNFNLRRCLMKLVVIEFMCVISNL